ncbi:MAG: ABC transporter ATP-binding protein [Acidimicrobiia bacterium]
MLQIVSGVSLAAQFFVGREILAAFSSDRTERPTMGGLLPSFVALGVLMVITGLVAVATRGKEILIGELVTRHVTARVVDVTTSAPYQAFEDPGFHDQLQRARANGATYTWSMVSAMVSLVAAFIGIAATGTVLFAIAPLLILVVVVAYIPLALATLRNGRSQYEFAYAMTPNDRERTYLGDALMGKREAKELRVFGLAQFLRNRYESLYDERIDALRVLVRTITRRSLVANIGSALVTVGAVVVLASMAVDDRINVADAGLAALALQQMTGRIRAINGSVGTLHQCSLFFSDYVRFVSGANPEARGIANDRPLTAGRFERLELSGVSFTYPGTSVPVLRDLDVSIDAGEVVALVGENGSGKTTLAKLICGLYEPTAGRVEWDGSVCVAQAPVAAIFQDFVQYELSGRDNIAVGDHRRFTEEPSVVAAAELADADRFLAALPEGYATRLSRSYAGGVDLSVGQWQRVALARAFFADRPFLVLDEPTAALDARAEAELFASMRDLYKGRTVLLISHRFSSVMTADRILVLKQGRLIEQGTHAELMALDGHYAELFNLQASAYLEDSAS